MPEADSFDGVGLGASSTRWMNGVLTETYGHGLLKLDFNAESSRSIILPS